jgi:hypothetical protein
MSCAMRVLPPCSAWRQRRRGNVSYKTEAKAGKVFGS